MYRLPASFRSLLTALVLASASLPLGASAAPPLPPRPVVPVHAPATIAPATPAPTKVTQPALYERTPQDLVRLRTEGAASHVVDASLVTQARALVETHGVAQPEAVAAELAHLHPAVLDALRAHGYRVVVSEGNIAASLPDAQKAYGSLTSLHMPGDKTIHVAVGSDGHLLHEATGSLSYVLYSVGAAVGEMGGSGSSTDPAFRVARLAERARLAPHYRSVADGGVQPTEAAADTAAFSEGFAFHFTNDNAFDNASPMQRYFAARYPAARGNEETARADGAEVRAIGNGNHFTVVVPRAKDAPSIYEITRRRGLPTTNDNLRAVIEDVSYDDAVLKASGWATANHHPLAGSFRAYNFHDVASTRASIAARQAHTGGKSSPDGWSDVHVHGNANGVLQEEKADGTRVTYTPAQFADVLRKQGYDGGPVRLVACETGAPVRFGANTAQQLANALGAPVVAASEYSWAHADGRVATQAATQNPDHTWKLGEMGRWRVYVPAPTN